MSRALLDATALIAAADRDDADHQRGLEILRGIDYGELPDGVITNEALLETLNFVEERKGHDRAVDLLDRFVQGAHFELQYNPKKNFGLGRSLFRGHPGLNFGDSMQTAFMESENIEYIYSFDDDFDSIDGVTRLNSAVNPY
ncbi:PIN domain-containing protein [Halomicrobium mukohataei]|uniref:PIN domain-containing protein n=1 Tax=Halomicrobium mukohataei TaxID=57705 RepID=A0A847UCQ7_9EURY|nr:PIN domain-containing protein [Halomicrobium mukohataei]NLV08721.1 PIN domain-containing protein [Halomicrobium mukohataei]